MMEMKTLKVEGMSCEHCVRAVTQAIDGCAGTKKIKVDLQSGTASFDFNPDKTSLVKIKTAIEEAGFTAID